MIPRSEGVRTDQWKYVLYPDEEPPYEQLFDLQADPNEISNLASDPAASAKLAELRVRLVERRRAAQ